MVFLLYVMGSICERPPNRELYGYVNKIVFQTRKSSVLVLVLVSVLKVFQTSEVLSINTLA